MSASLYIPFFFENHFDALEISLKPQPPERSFRVGELSSRIHNVIATELVDGHLVIVPAIFKWVRPELLIQTFKVPNVPFHDA